MFVTIISCKKDLTGSDGDDNTALKTSTQSIGAMETISSGTCIEDFDGGTGFDTILKPTVVGYQLINQPYSLANMQQAYINLYGTADGVALTHKYVRFRPSSPEQLSLIEDLDIDLFDHPLDYDVLQHGDYYNDGVTPAEDIPWLYAVVDLGFLPPAGITYEVLQQVHLPALAAVEIEAFRITGNPTDNSDCGTTGTTGASAEGETASNGSTQNQNINCDAYVCPDGYVWDYSVCDCVPTSFCPPGYHWDGVQCVPDGPPTPTPTRQPSGTITVFDNNLNANRPVRNARVVAKRFLKIERTNTNNQGQYFISKEFNKVHLLVKFKNEQARIRSLRRARLWQMLLSVSRNLGKHSGTLNNIIHNIDYNPNALSDGARDWAAASAHNNVQEYYNHAQQQGIGVPPQGLKILLTNWKNVGGSAPMFAKRFWQTLPTDFVTVFVIGSQNAVAGGFAALAVVLKSQVDVTVGYNINSDAEPNRTKRIDRVTELTYHELTHAAHYNKVGNSWWQDFYNAELYEIGANIGNGRSPYGDGSNQSTAPIIALGESWANHVGHFLTDQKYTPNPATITEQGINYSNGSLNDGGTIVFIPLNTHTNFLEDFSPNRTADVFRWIPQGLYYDLMDDRNDGLFARVLLDDNVDFYTNQRFFNALDDDIFDLTGFRMRLLNENANAQSAGVTQIFQFYGY